MKPSEAPPLSLATLGHPANNQVIFKDQRGHWRYLHDTTLVPEEQFRAGWHLRELKPIAETAPYGYICRFGTNELALARAESRAHDQTAYYGGMRVHHVVELGDGWIEDNDGVHDPEHGSFYVVDNVGLDVLRKRVDDGYADWMQVLYTTGLEPDEITEKKEQD